MDDEQNKIETMRDVLLGGGAYSIDPRLNVHEHYGRLVNSFFEGETIASLDEQSKFYEEVFDLALCESVKYRTIFLILYHKSDLVRACLHHRLMRESSKENGRQLGKHKL